jgi:hypothetical protein
VGGNALIRVFNNCLGYSNDKISTWQTQYCTHDLHQSTEVCDMYGSLGMQMNTRSLLMQVIGIQIGIWVDELYHVPLSFLCLG